MKKTKYLSVMNLELPTSQNHNVCLTFYFCVQPVHFFINNLCKKCVHKLQSEMQFIDANGNSYMDLKQFKLKKSSIDLLSSKK